MLRGGSWATSPSWRATRSGTGISPSADRSSPACVSPATLDHGRMLNRSLGPGALAEKLASLRVEIDGYRSSAVGAGSGLLRRRAASERASRSSTGTAKSVAASAWPGPSPSRTPSSRRAGNSTSRRPERSKTSRSASPRTSTIPIIGRPSRAPRSTSPSARRTRTRSGSRGGPRSRSASAGRSGARPTRWRRSPPFSTRPGTAVQARCPSGGLVGGDVAGARGHPARRHCRLQAQSDLDQVRLAHRAIPEAWLEDPPFQAITLDPRGDWLERVSLDGYVLAAVDLDDPEIPPAAVNIKAPRVGGWLEALRCLEECRRRALRAYVGGMLEVDVGRSQARVLASLFTAERVERPGAASARHIRIRTIGEWASGRLRRRRRPRSGAGTHDPTPPEGFARRIRPGRVRCDAIRAGSVRRCASPGDWSRPRTPWHRRG